jgi:tetratricopeptide (TPR) repeat protein
MKRIVIAGMLAFCAAIPGLMAQGKNQTKGPVPKSKGEAEAINAMIKATDPDSRIKAADALITKYADTQFKDLAFFVTAYSYQQKGDVVKMQIYAEKTLEVNPKYHEAMLMLAEAIERQTQEHDLDRDQKLSEVQKYANQAIETIQSAPKPNSQMTDEDWEKNKKNEIAEAHNDLGVAAMIAKKNDIAIAEFKTAIDAAATPEPAYEIRLASVYRDTGKNDEAIALCDKIAAEANVPPQIKQIAQSIRATAMKNKSSAAATPGAAPAAAPNAAAPSQTKQP